MKKLVLFFTTTLLVYLFGLQMVMAQTSESCIKYNKNRTMEEFRQIILTGTDPFIRMELWPAYAELANKILQTSKLEKVRSLVITPDFVGMKWLMEHSKLYEHSYFKQSDYFNGVRVDSKLDYRDVEGQESDWSVLEYEDILPKNGMYGKTACGNAEKPKWELLVGISSTPPPSPKKEPEKVVEHRWQDFVDNKKISNDEIIIVDDENSGFYKWQKRNGWWAYSLASAAVVTGVGFVAHDNQHQWYLWFPKSSSPHGTMSDGRAFTTNTGTGTQDGGRGN